MTQSSCKRDTKSKSHPSVRLAPVRVFSCKHPLILKLDGDTELARAVDVMMTRAKRIYNIETLVKVWESSKKLWKHAPAARAPQCFSFSQTSTSVPIAR